MDSNWSNPLAIHISTHLIIYIHAGPTTAPHSQMPTTIGMTSFQAAIHYMHNYALILLHVRLYCCWCCCWWQKHCLHANYYINKYNNLSWRVLQLLRINKNLWHGQSKYPHHRRMQNEWLCADNNKCAISTASVVVHGLRPPPPHRVIMAWSAGAVDGNTLLKEAQLTENYLTNWLRHDQPASQPTESLAKKWSERHAGWRWFWIAAVEAEKSGVL